MTFKLEGVADEAREGRDLAINLEKLGDKPCNFLFRAILTVTIVVGSRCAAPISVLS
jgi:hypothetical protein